MRSFTLNTERGRERETEREKERQTDKQRQTDRQTEKKRGERGRDRAETGKKGEGGGAERLRVKREREDTKRGW